MLGYKNLKFNDNNEIWYKGKLKMSIVPCPNLYTLRWPNGDLSNDVYNLQRAKDTAKYLVLKELNDKQIEVPSKQVENSP